jgi:hypothetical protein
MTPAGEQRIRTLRAFAYSLDGVRLIAVAPGEEVSLRVGAAQGLIDEGYAEPIAGDALPPRRRRAPDRRN